MEPNNSETRVCPRCSGKMREQEGGTYKCSSCGYEATENSLESGSDSRQ